MTERDWTQIVALIATNWPHAVPPDEAFAKWFSDVADLEGLQAYAAVEALYRDGREFAPNGAQIRAKVIELAADVPEWSVVYRRLGLLFRYPDSVAYADESGEIKRESPREVKLDAEHPLIGAFVRSVGWDQVNAGFGEGSDEARLREKWRSFVGARTRDAAYAGIPSAGLAALERGNSPRRVGAAIAAIKGAR